MAEHKQNKKISKSTKAGIVFPVGRLQRHLRNGNYANQIRTAAAVYLAGVLEYLSAEVLELAGNATEQYNKKRIVPRHILLAIKNDAELNKLLEGVDISEGGVTPNIHPLLATNQKTKKKKHIVENEVYSENEEALSENEEALSDNEEALSENDNSIDNETSIENETESDHDNSSRNVSLSQEI